MVQACIMVQARVIQLCAVQIHMVWMCMVQLCTIQSQMDCA